MRKHIYIQYYEDQCILQMKPFSNGLTCHWLCWKYLRSTSYYLWSIVYVAAFKPIHSKNQNGRANTNTFFSRWLYSDIHFSLDACCTSHFTASTLQAQIRQVVGHQMMWLLCAPVSSDKHSTSICHNDEELLFLLQNATVFCLYMCLLYWSLSSSCVSVTNQ